MRIRAGERERRFGQRVGRDVDRVIRERLLPLEHGVDQQARLERAAAAELDELERSVERAGDLTAVGREQIPLDAREVVLGKPRDRFEQRRPQVVVEVLRREPERTRAEAGADVLGEAGRANGCGSR